MRGVAPQVGADGRNHRVLVAAAVVVEAQLRGVSPQAERQSAAEDDVEQTESQSAEEEPQHGVQRRRA